MRKTMCWMALLLVASAALTSQMPVLGQGKAPKQRQGDLKVGDLAPDFTVQDVQGKQTVKLSDLRGKPVMLIFGSCT